MTSGGFLRIVSIHFLCIIDHVSDVVGMGRPQISETIIFADGAKLAAQLSCVFAHRGTYLPVCDGPRIQRPDGDSEVVRQHNAAARAFPLLILSEARLHDFDLTHFPRAEPTAAPLENAMEKDTVFCQHQLGERKLRRRGKIRRSSVGILQSVFAEQIGNTEIEFPVRGRTLRP